MGRERGVRRGGGKGGRREEEGGGGGGGEVIRTKHDSMILQWLPLASQNEIETPLVHTPK